MNVSCMQLYFSQSDVAQGAAEERSEPYETYGERVLEAATPRSAESSKVVSGFARKQIAAVRRIQR